MEIVFFQTTTPSCCFFFLCCFFFFLNCCCLFYCLRHKFDSDCLVWLLPPTHFRQGKGRGTKGSPWGRWTGRGSMGGVDDGILEQKNGETQGDSAWDRKKGAGFSVAPAWKSCESSGEAAGCADLVGAGLSLHFPNKLPGDVKAVWEKVLITTIRIRQKDLLERASLVTRTHIKVKEVLRIQERS